jgi:hypothetical protein
LNSVLRREADGAARSHTLGVPGLDISVLGVLGILEGNKLLYVVALSSLFRSGRARLTKMTVVRDGRDWRQTDMPWIPKKSSLEAIEAATRVLSALLERQDPTPADIERLKAYAPSLADVPHDELACGVICLVIESR